MPEDVAIEKGIYQCHECVEFAEVLRPDRATSKVFTPLCKKHANAMRPATLENILLQSAMADADLTAGTEKV